ncbi:MAG: signal peptide peptidase SppA [Campylobacteraceae bacterium]|jgi:protease-4|nr:signal peptide peptidase SppA [Campylobacteraceae bacterium]
MNEQNKRTGIFSAIKNILGFIQNYFKALIFILILYIIFIAPSHQTQDNSNLMKIDLKGVITDSEDVLKNINFAYDNYNIKGVLFVVDSPGGAVSPSIEISMAIKRLIEKKPVVAYAAGSMASGSYYACAYSDYIIANPGSVVGSIGVIMQTPNIEELARKIGISEQVVSAGDYKEAGTFMRKWTPKERESLQELVDDIYNLFVDDIVKARGLDRAKADEFANARVFIASKAQKVGLIDEVGSITDAQNALMKLSNVSDPIWKEPDLIDKLTKKLTSETKVQISSLFYGLKAY